MRIGVIGTGNIGSTVGRLLLAAGHELHFAGRDDERAQALAASLGVGASAGSVEDAARFGPVVLLAVPYGALPALAEQLADALEGRIVIDAANPFGARDGAIAGEVSAAGRGSGAYTAELFTGAQVVKAFNTLGSDTLLAEANRADGRLGMLLAGDEPGALQLVAGLVSDAGYDPVALMPLTRARDFDAGTPPYGQATTADELRRLVGDAEPSPAAAF